MAIEAMTDRERKALESDRLLERVLEDIGVPIHRCTQKCLPCQLEEPEQ